MDDEPPPIPICNTCKRPTDDIYRVKRAHPKTRLMVIIVQCAECYEIEMSRLMRWDSHQPKPLSE